MVKDKPENFEDFIDNHWRHFMYDFVTLKERVEGDRRILYVILATILGVAVVRTAI